MHQSLSIGVKYKSPCQLQQIYLSDIISTSVFYFLLLFVTGYVTDTKYDQVRYQVRHQFTFLLLLTYILGSLHGQNIVAFVFCKYVKLSLKQICVLISFYSSIKSYYIMGIVIYSIADGQVNLLPPAISPFYHSIIAIERNLQFSHVLLYILSK